MNKKLSFATIGFLVAMWFGIKEIPGSSHDDLERLKTPDVKTPDSQRGEAKASQQPKKVSEITTDAARTIASESDPVADFQRETLTPFEVAKDPFTGRLRTMSGGRYSKPGETPEDFLKKRSLDLFGIAPEKLKATKTVDADRTKYVFQQFEGGRPVFGQTVSLVYEGDVLVRIQNDLQPVTPAEPAPVADSMKEAFDIYSRSLADGSAPRLVRGEDLLFPYGQGQAVAAYRFHTSERVNGVEGEYEVLFDAENLRVIRKRSSRIE